MIENLLELSKIWDRGVAVIKQQDNVEVVMLVVEMTLYNPANHIYNHEISGHVINKWISERMSELSNSSSNLRNYMTYFENLPVHTIQVYDINCLKILSLNKKYEG